MAEEGADWVKVTIQRRIAKPEVMRLLTGADARFQLTQRERITLGILGQTEGMTARELGAILETHGADELAGWLGRLQTLALVQSTGRPQGTRYFVDPALLLGADLKIPTTLLRIEPHQLLELIREDLQRYPLSKIGDISGRIGPEVNISQLKRALAELVSLGVVVMTGERSAARYRLAKKSDALFFGSNGAQSNKIAAFFEPNDCCRMAQHTVLFPVTGCRSPDQ